MRAIPVAIVRGAIGAVQRLPVKNGHEHGWDVLEAVLALNAGKEFCVAAEFIGDLVDDERRMYIGRQGLVDTLEKQPLLAHLHRREGDPRDHVIAMQDAERRKFLGQIGRVGIEHGDPGIIAEVVPEVVGEFRVEFEKEQAGIGMHPPHDLPGVTALPRAELGDNPRHGKVEFARYAVDQDLGTRDDGSDLHGALEEPLEE